jgi:hypothetical protein
VESEGTPQFTSVHLTSPQQCQRRINLKYSFMLLAQIIDEKNILKYLGTLLMPEIVEKYLKVIEAGCITIKFANCSL